MGADGVFVGCGVVVTVGEVISVITGAGVLVKVGFGVVCGLVVAVEVA